MSHTLLRSPLPRGAFLLQPAPSPALTASHPSPQPPWGLQGNVAIQTRVPEPPEDVTWRRVTLCSTLFFSPAHLLVTTAGEARGPACMATLMFLNVHIFHLRASFHESCSLMWSQHKQMPLVFDVRCRQDHLIFRFLSEGKS